MWKFFSLFLPLKKSGYSVSVSECVLHIRFAKNLSSTLVTQNFCQETFARVLRTTLTHVLLETVFSSLLRLCYNGEAQLDGSLCTKIGYQNMAPYIFVSYYWQKWGNLLCKYMRFVIETFKLGMTNLQGFFEFSNFCITKLISEPPTLRLPWSSRLRSNEKR